MKANCLAIMALLATFGPVAALHKTSPVTGETSGCPAEAIPAPDVCKSVSARMYIVRTTFLAALKRNLCRLDDDTIPIEIVQECDAVTVVLKHDTVDGWHEAHIRIGLSGSEDDEELVCTAEQFVNDANSGALFQMRVEFKISK